MIPGPNSVPFENSWIWKWTIVKPVTSIARPMKVSMLRRSSNPRGQTKSTIRCVGFNVMSPKHNRFGFRQVQRVTTRTWEAP